MTESIAQLRQLSDADLIQRHGNLAKDTQVGTAHDLAELGRRDQQKTSDEMLRYTREMDKMTRRITFLTV
jgi:dihydrodipicolinate reductase